MSQSCSSVVVQSKHACCFSALKRLPPVSVRNKMLLTFKLYRLLFVDRLGFKSQNVSLQDRAAVFNRGSLCACSMPFHLDKCVRWELKRKALGPRSDSKQVTCRGRIFSCHSRSLCSEPVRVGLSVCSALFSPSIIISLSLYSPASFTVVIGLIHMLTV